MTESLPERLRKTAKLVNDIIWQREKPSMRIPADPERDTDLVVGAVFRDAAARIEELERRVHDLSVSHEEARHGR